MNTSSINYTSFSPEEISALFALQDRELAFSHEGLLYLGVVKRSAADDSRNA